MFRKPVDFFSEEGDLVDCFMLLLNLRNKMRITTRLVNEYVPLLVNGNIGGNRCLKLVVHES